MSVPDLRGIAPTDVLVLSSWNLGLLRPTCETLAGEKTIRIHVLTGIRAGALPRARWMASLTFLPPDGLSSRKARPKERGRQLIFNSGVRF